MKSARWIPLRLALLALAGIVIALMAAPRTGIAQGGSCIEDLTGKQCTGTANDVRIAELRNAEEITCESGELVDLDLTARLVAGASERYDIGIFVALDGGTAQTGTCQHDYLPPPLSAGGTCSVSPQSCHWDGNCPAGESCTGGYDPQSGSGPFFNAEFGVDSADLCGDIEKEVETLYDLATVRVPCEDTNGDGYLDIGTSLSWDNNTQTTCVDVNGALPGAPSKCQSEMITVANVIVHGRMVVAKVAEPNTVPEPGADVQFTFTVTNPSEANIILQSLEDSVYGNLIGYAGSTCTAPQPLVPAASYSCTITAPVTGEPGSQTNTVTASGIDQNQDPISDTAVAQVVITDLQPTLVLTKTVAPISMLEPGGVVTYTIDVKNTSAPSDPVTLTSLADSLYGDLADPANSKITGGTCQLVVIDAGDTYHCQFKAEVTGTAGSTVTDTATAIGLDNEANQAQASDDVAVAIVSGLSLEVSKSVTPECIIKAGDTATYTVVITNPNLVPLELTSLTDDIYDDLTDGDNPKISDSTCELSSVGPSQSYACTFKAAVIIGKAGYSMTNTVTVEATDRAGKTVQDSDDATVSLCILPPDTGVALPPPVITGGLTALGLGLAAAGAWLRRRRR